LSICKGIVELHGGTIIVDSVHGRGSIFSVSLDLPLVPSLVPSLANVAGPATTSGPAAAGDLSKPDGSCTSPSTEESDLHVAKAQAQLTGCTVLVADDIDMNRFVVSELLHSFGCHVETACDGREAVEAVEARRARATPFDAVLMDVQMPHLNGLDAAAAIRRSEAHDGGPRLPIIALTGFAGVEERSAAWRTWTST